MTVADYLYVRLWLNPEVQSPEIDFRYAPESGPSSGLHSSEWTIRFYRFGLTSQRAVADVLRLIDLECGVDGLGAE